MSNTLDRPVQWFLRPDPRAHARLRLFCFPYAGGGAAVYREWSRVLPSWVDLCAVQPPGRAWRLREPAFTRAPELAAAVANAVEPLLDIPHLFFGHSLGAVVAFETARELRRRNAAPPVRLVVSARRAPHIPDERAPVFGLPEPEFLDEVSRRYDGGIPAPLLAEPEILKVVLPALRADLEMDWSYQLAADQSLDCPISAVGGADDGIVSLRHLAGWSDHTTGPFTVQVFPGDHFFINEASEALVRLILKGLAIPDNRPAANAGTATARGSQ